MTDNVTVPATGSGTATPVVATDDVAGVHYQRVKLVDGTLDGTGAIGGDATNGLDVDPTRLPYANNSASVSSATTLWSLDAASYRYFSFYLSGTWVGTVTPQVSNDNATWFTAFSRNSGGGGVSSPYTQGGWTSNVLITGPITARYFRIQVTAYTSGTVVCDASVSSIPAPDLVTGVTDNNASLTTDTAGQIAHDAVLGGSFPLLGGGYASAAAPTDVSADGDAVRAWFLRNGAQAVNITAAGALVGGDAANGLDVDVTRVSGGAIAHDGVGTSQSPLLVGGYASAAAPSDVSADGDATRAWLLRNGAQAVAITAAGALIGGDATGGLHSQGAIAHDGVDSGNPVKVGGKATTSLAAVSTAGDRTNNISDMYGRQLTSHIDPTMQIYKSYNDTASRAAGSAQIIWTPAGGKKIAITNLVISAYGTTSARMFLFFAAAADLTYNAGTDQPVFVGSFSPSATAKPGMVLAPATPIFAATADYKLLYQNDAALSVDITVYGYEF